MYWAKSHDLVSSMSTGCYRGTKLMPQTDKFAPQQFGNSKIDIYNDSAADVPTTIPPQFADQDRQPPYESPKTSKQSPLERPERGYLTFTHSNPSSSAKATIGTDSRSMSRWFRSRHFQAVWERLDSGSSETRPSHPYTELIKLCILKRPEGKLTLNQLYRDLEDKFPFFAASQKGKGWKNTLRHNLSTQAYFIKLDREHGQLGKGHYWAYCPDLEKPTSLAQSSVVQLSSLWPPSVSATTVLPREESARELSSATHFKHSLDFDPSPSTLPRFEDYSLRQEWHELPRIHHPPTHRLAPKFRSFASPIPKRRSSSPARHTNSLSHHSSNESGPTTRMRSATIPTFSRLSFKTPTQRPSSAYDRRRSDCLWQNKDTNPLTSSTSSLSDIVRDNSNSSSSESSAQSDDAISRLPPLLDLPLRSAPAHHSLGDYYLSNPISRR